MKRSDSFWHNYFLDLAEQISRASKDPSTKAGALIVDQNRRSVSWGYNGLPRGLLDTNERLNIPMTKYAITLHAEHNAILFAQRDLKGCILYATHRPCQHCAATILQTQLATVYYRHIIPEARCPDSSWMFEEAGVGLIQWPVAEAS